MRIEDAVEHLRDTDNYTYKLNIHDVTRKKE